MAQSEKNNRQPDVSPDPETRKPMQVMDPPGRDGDIGAPGDGRSWTLRRIEGVIGSVA
ncbi:MAG: hypothetical protein AAF686_07265 [Pseudomonadota bacterium]